MYSSTKKHDDDNNNNGNTKVNGKNSNSNMKASTQISTTQKSLDNMQARLKAARQIYSNPERKAQELLQHRAREHLRQTMDDLKSGGASGETTSSTSAAQLPQKRSTEHQRTQQALPGASASSETTEVVDLRTGNTVHLPPAKDATSSENASTLKPIHNKDNPSYSQSAGQPAVRPDLSQRSLNLMQQKPLSGGDGKPNSRQSMSGIQGPTCTGIVTVQRSKTSVLLTDVRPQLYVDLERQARTEAERAMRDKKVFTVLGPYPTLRASLRKRGWVEKMNNQNPSVEAVRQSTGGKSRDDGTIISMMSHFVRNCTPALVFAVKAVDVGSKVTKSTQLVNHYGKASTFTTKAGLCHNLRSVPWFKNVDPNTFYPRCYNLGDAEEKEAFYEDYRLTACMSFLKYFVQKYESKSGKPSPAGSPISARRLSTGSSPGTPRRASDCNIRRKSSAGQALSRDITKLMISRNTTSQIIAAAGPISDSDGSTPVSPSRRGSLRRASLDSGDATAPNAADASNQTQSNNNPLVENPTPGSSPAKTLKGKRLSLKMLEIAMTRCQKYLTHVEHGDLDHPEEPDTMTPPQWDQYLNAYHQFISNEIEVDKKALDKLPNCKQLLDKLKRSWSQFDLDGHCDVWIFKPGAKSRGRGIQCSNKLADINEAINASDCTLVAQKYIERPFLIYKTKFDIRQWFLVTDWNPLTIWFYGANYLRFCSQEYTLNSFHISIHLSNNSVQKYFTAAPTRSEKLPADNMWKSDEFEAFLREEGYGEVWSKKVIPGMKQAILCVMLCTQDQVEHRKSAFELYGADFMLTEDLRPWLIEINSSPSMARTTQATADLVDEVLEDTVKVVLDRKQDRNCDTGLFELIYRQQQIADPPQQDVCLSVEGHRIRKQINNTL